ncbi:hypothetical protein HK405_002049, partial [Cladochytrium tenue]
MSPASVPPIQDGGAAHATAGVPCMVIVTGTVPAAAVRLPLSPATTLVRQDGRTSASASGALLLAPSSRGKAHGAIVLTHASLLAPFLAPCGRRLAAGAAVAVVLDVAIVRSNNKDDEGLHHARDVTNSPGSQIQHGSRRRPAAVAAASVVCARLPAPAAAASALAALAADGWRVAGGVGADLAVLAL